MKDVDRSTDERAFDRPEAGPKPVEGEMLEDLRAENRRLEALIMECRKARDTMRVIVDGTSSATGREYLRSLVRHLALALGFRYAFVGRVMGGRYEKIKTLAVWANGDFAGDFEYALANTPCENVVGKSLCSYPSGVRKLFPEDPLLAGMEAESYTGVPLFSSDGKALGILAALDDKPLNEGADVSSALKVFAARASLEIERKVAEEELKRSGERLKEAQRIAHIGDWEWDMEGDGMFWSDEVYRIFGLEPEGLEVTYGAFLDSVHPDDRDFVGRSLNNALNGLEPYAIDHRIVLPDGRVRIVNGRAEVAFDADGRPARLFGTMQDVTEKKLMEDEILKAKKLETIGNLAGAIAHDFNNLLVGIIGRISVAMEHVEKDGKLHEMLREVEAAALRTKGLTRQLLTFSRGGRPVKEAASVVDLLRSTADLVLRESGIRCEFSFPDGDVYADMDQGQVGQAMNNIILNARQAMDEGGLVEIEAKNVTVAGEDPLPMDHGRYVMVSIKDNGRGIPEENLDRIFDPFFTTRQRASGLGLAVTYSVIRKHGGHITVESKEGKGTTVRVYLPAFVGRPPSAPGSLKVERGSGRVLLMDDDEIVRDVAGEMLEFLGYDYSFARDGAEAIALFKKAIETGAPFDAVILDLTVEDGMGGADAVKKLVRIDPHVKAIVSSGYSRDPIMSDYGKHGFCAVMHKPYRLAEFSRAVKDAISGRG